MTDRADIEKQAYRIVRDIMDNGRPSMGGVDAGYLFEVLKRLLGEIAYWREKQERLMPQLATAPYPYDNPGSPEQALREAIATGKGRWEYDAMNDRKLFVPDDLSPLKYRYQDMTRKTKDVQPELAREIKKMQREDGLDKSYGDTVRDRMSGIDFGDEKPKGE